MKLQRVAQGATLARGAQVATRYDLPYPYPYPYPCPCPYPYPYPYPYP